MAHTHSSAAQVFVDTLAKALNYLVRAAAFLLQRPLFVVVLSLLVMWSTISTLALFNPVIAEHFNRSVAYLGLATVAYEVAAEAGRSLAKTQADLDREKRKTANTQADLDAEKTRNVKTQANLNAEKERRQSLESRVMRQDVTIEQRNQHISRQQQLLAKSKGANISAKIDLKDTKNRLTQFSRKGRLLEERVKKSFTRIAVRDATGEILGWIPLVGDVVSIGLAAKSLHEMCLMFEEIEKATVDLGAPYMIYTDTFCDKPVETTKEVVVETGNSITEEIRDRARNTQEYLRIKIIGS